MFDMFTSRNVNKIFKYPLSRPTTMSDQIVGLRECWLSNLLDILGGICPTREYDHWYTWSVLYIYFWSHYIPWHTLIKDNFWNNSPSHDKLVLCLLWGNIRLHRVLKMCRRPAISPFTFTLSPVKNLSSMGFPTIFMFMWIVIIAFCWSISSYRLLLLLQSTEH